MSILPSSRSPAKAGVQSAPKQCSAWTPGAPAFAGARSPKGERGFTLVEMLVALSIFAAIAAMGVTMLRSSVDTQDAVQARLKAMGGVNRVRAVMANDLAQALPRSTRGLSGEAVPAFIGSETGFAFVHGGAASLDGGGRPDVERVAYALSGDEWRRAAQPMLDGVALGDGDRMIGDVAAVAIRYRDGDGQWSGVWTSDPGDRLPQAVEVRLTRRDREPLVMLFLTAPAPVRPPQAVPAP